MMAADITPRRTVYTKSFKRPNGPPAEVTFTQIVREATAKEKQDYDLGAAESQRFTNEYLLKQGLADQIGLPVNRIRTSEDYRGVREIICSVKVGDATHTVESLVRDWIEKIPLGEERIFSVAASHLDGDCLYVVECDNGGCCLVVYDKIFDARRVRRIFTERLSDKNSDGNLPAPNRIPTRADIELSPDKRKVRIRFGDADAWFIFHSISLPDSN
jgi:hypothetical protein